MQLQEIPSQSDRQSWMRELALARSSELNQLWEKLSLNPSYTLLRPTESGLVQVRGKMGNTGNRFNMGDMTVTRASVKLNGNINGFAYIHGRDKQHAETAAIIDALMQSSQHQQLQTAILTPLQQSRQQRTALKTAETLSTKVDFFTLIRGENE